MNKVKGLRTYLLDNKPVVEEVYIVLDEKGLRIKEIRDGVNRKRKAKKKDQKKKKSNKV